MKKLILIIVLFLNLEGFSQKIDYNNFDNKMATKILMESFLRFRDTINSFGSGIKWNIEYPETDSFPNMNKPRWSEWLYKTISLGNCTELSNDYNLEPYHVNRDKWFKDNIKLVRKEYYKDFKKIPLDLIENSRLSYSENAVSLDYKVETYEQLAKIMIDNWEKSIYHRSAQRGLFYDHWAYVEYGLKIQDLFSCCVIYNPNTGFTKAVINFIE